VSEKTPREMPQLGIFWLVQMSNGEARLLAAGCPLDQAEPYGDCLTYGPGHYETWAQWRRDRTVDLQTTMILSKKLCRYSSHDMRGQISARRLHMRQSGF
jgi:hypothetical protein